MDFARVDSFMIPAINRENNFKLPQVRFDSRLHIGVLQLAGKRFTFQGLSTVYLPKRRRGGGVMFETDTLRQLPVTYVLGASNAACPLDASIVAAGAAM